ncbi:hypothetical protein [Streptomyces sp. HNM0574]|uniref:LppU/SCO3897 family protein n=1 Tax=Streptomyces sp. HNM0574 TaxID=2714954 RepID=UPI00146D27B6|nr:hypothetical protein [Streptomyces sp. HNM0574]NLU66633.1 hypothetical protein [Streptomyces sp. HNM0574]
MSRGKHRRREADEGELTLEEAVEAELRGELADTPADRARRGRWWLIIAAVLFATVVLPRIVGPESHSTAAPATPRPSASEGSPSPGTRSGSPAPTAGSAAPEPSATGRGRAVRAGDCLSAHHSDEGTGWNTRAPAATTRVPCNAADARVRVTAVREKPGDCPTGRGRDAWRAAGTSGAALCLTRQFRQDDCLLAAPAGAERGEAEADRARRPGADSGTGSGTGPDSGSGSGGVRADLMSAPDCGLRALPQPYDRVLTVTGIHQDAPRTLPSGFCADGRDGGRGRAWRVGAGDTVVCTTTAR